MYVCWTVADPDLHIKICNNLFGTRCYNVPEASIAGCTELNVGNKLWMV